MASRPDEWEAAENPPTPLEMSVIKRFTESGYNFGELGKCAKEAGVSAQFATKALKKLSNNPLFQKALKKQGVTMERMAQKIAELMEAKHPQYPTQNDNLAQIKALDMAMKAADVYPSQKIELDKTETQHIIISAQVIQAVERAKGIKVIDVEPEPVKGTF
jgi:hypothetical protein